MRIVFFGTPEAAVTCLDGLLRAGFTVPLVITQPSRPAGRGLKPADSAVKRYSFERGILVLEPEKIRRDEAVVESVRAAAPDVGVVVAYGQIMPASIIYLPPRKTLNVHFSLLPRYRGAAPVQWAILNGESETGVSIMELNEKMDEGDVLAQVRTDIGPEEDAVELEKRLAAMGAELLVDTLGRMDSLERRPQDHSLATYAPRLKKEDALIIWTSGAVDVDRRVRAFAGQPGAYTFFRGLRLIVWKGRVPGTAVPAGIAPGTIVDVGREGLSVACGDGRAYLISGLQAEGRKRMDAWAFSQGARIRIGEVLAGYSSST
jgi:methionyl-tRNA formyltransferase